MSTHKDIKTLRRELAAALRLAAAQELNEGICNHFSVVVPGPRSATSSIPMASTGARCGPTTSC